MFHNYCFVILYGDEYQYMALLSCSCLIYIRKIDQNNLFNIKFTFYSELSDKFVNLNADNLMLESILPYKMDIFYLIENFRLGCLIM